MNGRSILEVQVVAKSFNGIEIFRNLSVSLLEGEIISIIGPSGCGKSTLLRMIAGLEDITTEDRINCYYPSTDLGFIFQTPILYPHLNVGGNILLGNREKLTNIDKKKVVLTALSNVGLDDFADRKVTSLSGGEAQRVILARALLAQPKLLLLDEPFSSLDIDARRSLASEVKGIIKKRNVSAIHVTHDLKEAELISDRVVNWSNICKPGITSNNNEQAQSIHEPDASSAD